MVIVETYSVAVLMCIITMLCWGSWANTQKLASREWRFQLFYWDYALGVLIFSLVLAFTLGSMGTGGRGFITDLKQAELSALKSAFWGGVIFNLSNILLVAAIDIAGMAVAFPIGVGLALVIGVVANYDPATSGNAMILFAGVASITVAIILDAIAYRKLSPESKTTAKGIILSIVAGVLMGFFYRFVAGAMGTLSEDKVLQAGKLSPYTALVMFSLGLFVSNFLWNSIVMIKPFVGQPVPFRDYFTKGSLKLHLVGILGGAIWNLGMSFSIIAAGAASFAISYGLGQGATMIAALWGVFIWKEFQSAPKGTSKLLTLMFVFYLAGLVLIIASKLI